MFDLLTKHWLAKLLSLLLAIGIWFLVKNRMQLDADYSAPQRSGAFDTQEQHSEYR